MSLVVEVDGLSKAFSKDLKKSLVFGLKDLVREVSGVGLARDYLRPTEFWSLRDINLKFKKGRDAWLDWPQWSRQEHFAEDTERFDEAQCRASQSYRQGGCFD